MKQAATRKLSGASRSGIDTSRQRGFTTPRTNVSDPRGGPSVAVIVGHFDPLVALGLAAVLSDDPRLRVLGSNLSLPDLLEAAARCAPQVAIFNETTERAARGRFRSCETRLLVFAHHPTATYGKMLLAAGAACVALSAPPAEILAAVHLVASGMQIFAHGDGRRFERCYPCSENRLTRREIEVLARLSEGKPHKQIAQELGIGVRTVETHTAQVCAKCGVRRKQELVGL